MAKAFGKHIGRNQPEVQYILWKYAKGSLSRDKRPEEETNNERRFIIYTLRCHMRQKEFVDGLLEAQERCGFGYHDNIKEEAEQVFVARQPSWPSDDEDPQEKNTPKPNIKDRLGPKPSTSKSTPSNRYACVPTTKHRSNRDETEQYRERRSRSRTRSPRTARSRDSRRSQHSEHSRHSHSSHRSAHSSRKRTPPTPPNRRRRTPDSSPERERRTPRGTRIDRTEYGVKYYGPRKK